MVPPAPSPPAAEAGAAPPPARRPLSRPAGRALALLAPLPESRLLPQPAYLRGRLRRFSPDPSSGHSSHTPPLVPHSLSLTHTHSATTAPERPTYYASLVCYVLCARARARKLGARLAKEGGGERRRVRRNIKALLGNEVPCFRAREGGGGEIPVSTSPANWLVGFVVFSFNVTCCVFIGCFQKRKRKANEGIDLYKARLATAA